QALEALWRQQHACFLVHLANHALQKRLVALTLAAEQADETGGKNVREIVAPLEQEPPLVVDKESDGGLAMACCGHESRGDAGPRGDLRGGGLRRWASSSISAAGVMPSMRAAWARLDGRSVSSF